jgi:hypothetical protein
VLVASAVLSAQTKAYKAPRTPDGQPDLQGFWTNSTYTPLERPDGVTKAYYTPAEAEAAIKLAVQREGAQTEPGTTADVHYDFSQFGLDRSQSLYVRNLRTSLIVDPPSGKIPPLSEEGKRRTARRAEEQKKLGGRWDSAESNQLDDRCLIMAGPGPPMMDAAYNSNYQIVQSPGYVMILTEMIHDVRIIPLTRAAHLPSAIGQWKGDSIGRWEGDTLVVDTTHVAPGTFMNNGFNHSEALHMVERFRASPDGSTLWLTQLYDDGAVFDGLAARYMAWTRRPGEFVYPYDCDPSYGE